MERELHLFEELCKKGKAYRAKRMAAGEKSSAYLSGRAVKVCKGQMQGESEDVNEQDKDKYGRTPDTRFKIDGKPVDLGSIEMGGLEDMRKYGPDDGGPNAYIESAYFLDGTELTDIQRDEFMDKYPDITHEKAVDQMYQQEGAVEEGSCGYGPDGIPGDTPGETKGMPADKRTMTMMREAIRKEIKRLHENK